ncbi:MAG TPA: HupE/UreJ family protein [Alphaproteobacteria bacterium]|nr:HupE/UreJ family protein [Alphaproteobacteria bacterium]
MIVRFLLFICLALLAGPAAAHESLPVYLGIAEETPGTFAVIWRVPATQGSPPAITPSFPPQCAAATSSTIEAAPGAIVGREVLKCAAPGLTSGQLTLVGLDRTVLDALVRIAFLDGRELTQVLHPNDPALALDGRTGHVDVGGYFGLGVEHILFGIDHLLFVTGLVLIVRRPWRLAKTITAFTVAHSITLALATLGFVHVPPAPVEAAIALSIVFLARELVRASRGESGLTVRQPWIVAFAFGLLHGFGFAGALAEVGLPRHDIPLALLLFNLGVEAGQLIFIALLLALRAAILRLAPRMPLVAARIPTYAIGAAAAFWLIQRVTVVL